MFRYFLTVGTIFLVGILHAPAMLFDWYFYFWWYDVGMHFLGGVAAGFGGLSLWYFLMKHSVHELTWRVRAGEFVFVLGCVALIGIAWEWMEAFVGYYNVTSLGMAQPGLLDTMLDFYFDLLGGFFAWVLSLVLFRSSSLSK